MIMTELKSWQITSHPKKPTNLQNWAKIALENTSSKQWMENCLFMKIGQNTEEHPWDLFLRGLFSPPSPPGMAGVLQTMGVGVHGMGCAALTHDRGQASWMALPVKQPWKSLQFCSPQTAGPLGLSRVLPGQWQANNMMQEPEKREPGPSFHPSWPRAACTCGRAKGTPWEADARRDWEAVCTFQVLLSSAQTSL